MESLNAETTIAKQIVYKNEKKNINLFLWGKFVSLVGTYMYSFAMSLYILKQTGSGTTFAVNLLLSALPRVILGPIAGVLADRLDRRKMVVGMDILSGITVLTLLPLSSLYGLRIPFIYANTLLLSIINTFFAVTISASLPSLVRKESLMKINSYNQAAESVSSIVSPMLGGVLYHILPIKLFIALNGVSFILSAISEMFIDFNFSKEEAEEKNTGKLEIKAIFDDMKTGFLFLREQKALFSLFKFAILINFFVSPCMSVTLPFIINNTLSLGEIHFGIIEGSFSVGALLSSLIIARLPERDKKLPALLLGLGCTGGLQLLMALPVLSSGKLFSDNIYAAYYMLMMFVLSISLMIVNIPIMVLIQRLTPDHMMGRMMSLTQTIASAVMPLGLIIMGMLVDLMPVYVSLLASGCILFLTVLMMKRSTAMREL